MTSSNPAPAPDEAPAPARAGSGRRRFLPILLILLGGLLLRLVITYVVVPGDGFSEDLKSFNRWAIALANFGPGSFFEHAGFADYPPGYLWFLWPVGVIGSALASLTGQPVESTTYALLKLPGIFADIGIAILLYWEGRRWLGERAGLVAAALFLFIPFTWYESALWGQMDSVGTLFLLASLLLLFRGWSEPAVAVAAFAFVIKPQYAVIFVILGPILLRRHMLLRGSGPRPVLGRWLAAVDRRLGGWFTRRQGIERLVACAIVAPLVVIAAIVPFDIWLDSKIPITGLPAVDHIAGLIGLTTDLANRYPVLTADAFNGWALVGPTPLTSELSRSFIWTYDSLPLIGSVSAVTVGILLLATVVILVAVVLLFRDDRTVILVGFTVLALAFFVLPTRAHERYQFPIFASAAFFAAVSLRWRWWYIAMAVLGTINLHAILTLNQPGFASPGLIGAPFGDLSRADATIIVTSLGNVIGFVLLLAVWLRDFVRPTLRVGWPGRAAAVAVGGGAGLEPGLGAAAADSTARTAADVAPGLPGSAALAPAPAVGSAALETRALGQAEPGRTQADGVASSMAAIAAAAALSASVATESPAHAGAQVSAAGATASSAAPAPFVSATDSATEPEPVPRSTSAAAAELLAPLARALAPISEPLGRRLFGVPPPEDRTALRAHEGGGRLDRKDLLAVGVILVLTLGTRLFNLDTPRTMYFDELYYPSTATEFLRDWRYDLPTNIFEWTHPHVSKYIMAASLVLLGNDQVTGTATVGAGVTDVAFEPAIADSTAPGGYRGDRIAVATADGVTILPHGDFNAPTRIGLPGVTAVAFDDQADVLYIGTNDGTILGTSAPNLDLGAAGLPSPPPGPAGRVDGPVKRLWVVAPGRLLAETGDGTLTLIDAGTGLTIGSTSIPGFAGIATASASGRTLIVAAGTDGLSTFDAQTLAALGVTRLATAPTGLALVDGSAFGWANQDMLPVPTLYVALAGDDMAALAVNPDGSLSQTDIFPMPGPVSEVRWDQPTNMVHVLGKTADGQPTIYVVEPHTDSVFADAALPFEPVAWTLDVQPKTPELDRQRALAFSANGDVAIVDTGSHAFAWRFPGVVAGALTAALMYLLARILFRRRSVAILLAVVMALDGLLFTQGRIAMNDAILGFFIVAAFTLLAALIRGPARGRLATLGMIVGLPVVGILLGLAFGTKWVGVYAMGGAVALVLSRTRLGRMLLLAGLIGLTTVLGYQALIDDPPNVTFMLIMLALTAVAAAAVARDLRPATLALPVGQVAQATDSGASLAPTADPAVDSSAAPTPESVPTSALASTATSEASTSGVEPESPGVEPTLAPAEPDSVPPLSAPAPPGPIEPPESSGPRWLDPRWHSGVPFVWAMACLLVIPVVVYVASYVPWALSVAGAQLFPGWPPGHTGQTFIDLQAQMYAYHNELRTPHGESSPWWSWPFALRPIWGYYDTFSNGSQSLILLAGNPVLMWLSVPAMAFGGWQAWRRRSAGLGLVVIALLALWLPWARIDRATFNYHWYTALPFAFLLLAYLLAELWDGPSRRTWGLAKVAFAVVLVAPALMWIFKGSLCTIAGVGDANPTSYICGDTVGDLTVPVGLWLVASLSGAWFVLGARRPRRLVAAIVAAAAAVFVALYPALSAMQIPNGLPLIYQRLLPTWDISFSFYSNTLPPSTAPLISIGLGLLLVLVIGVVWVVLRSGIGAPLVPAMAESGGGRPRPPAGSSVEPWMNDARSSQEPDPSGSTLAVPLLAGAGAGVAAGSGTPALTGAPPPTALAGAQPPASVLAAASPAIVATPPTGDGFLDRLAAWARPRRTAILAVSIPIGVFLLAASLYSVVNNGRPAILTYYVPLADALLHGELGLSAAFSGLNEVVPGGNGLYYVVYPPSPAVLLLAPVIVFGPGFEQANASIFLGAVNVAVMAVVLGQMGLARRLQVILALVFGFGTIVWFSVEVGTSWQLAHVVAIFFVLLSILACQRNGPVWLIGLLFAGGVLARLPVIGAAPFYLAYLAYRTTPGPGAESIPFGSLRVAGETVGASFRSIDRRRFLRLAVPMAIGFGLPAVLYLAYNAARFGSPLETGNALIPGVLKEAQYRDGIFSIAYIPNSLAAMFFSLPASVPGFPFFQPRLIGGQLSILLTSPILLWAFLARRPDWFNVGAWLAVIVILIPILTHGGTGDEQFGYRFAQDFYPFIFLLLVRGMGLRISRLAWAAIAFGIVVNVWGMVAAYYSWWA